ncbi:hypothetical protein, partial [Salmonella enterica]|uniref:hypothetical protein n=1 Tax=Salmonella enterica TaxID=28901 RepID=UPI001C385CC9
PVRSSCLSESGSTTEPRSGSGAEGGHGFWCWVLHATEVFLPESNIALADIWLSEWNNRQ